MDIPFLELMTKSYISDNSHLQLEESNILNLLIESFKQFKYNFPEEANKIYDKSRSYQQDLIYIYLDNVFFEQHHSDLEIDLYEFDLLNLKNRVSALFRSSETSTAFLTSIIEKNYNNCNGMCAKVHSLSREDANQLSHFMSNYNSNTNKRTEYKYEIIKIGLCLRFCYLDYLTSVYAEGILAFETCSKSLGKSIVIDNYTEMLTNFPLSSLCLPIHETLTKIFSEIIEFLKVNYPHNTIYKDKWLNVINNKISNLRSGKILHLNQKDFDDPDEHPTTNMIIR